MDIQSIAERKRAIIEQFGAWTNHNIRLAPDCYTMEPSPSGAEVKLNRFLQVVADFCGKDFSTLRVLDLACLEGLYGLELAMQGATVLGIEGRDSNLAKAQFAREVLELENIEFVCDDVRNLSPQKYGTFDVVLCIGIFYHLDAPDVFRFAENIAEVCTRLAILDTHVSSTAEKTYLYQGREYAGKSYTEDHTAWGSIDNEESTWLTRASLYDLLGEVGFSSVYECHVPVVPKYDRLRALGHADRSTFIALKSDAIELKTTDLLENP
ncbi:MAG: methyltransferase domain-containing protein [Cyanobacteria bacterium SID2]|nr:methyltransferase domain-containing protein [Cyanobacteria bacterium SID2]MBP0003651.1 methyltransferase domain-containing protein [Cyanobacteria bacterium SBC]